eukprot:3617451-Pyramimonas_sp.AAC.1
MSGPQFLAASQAFDQSSKDKLIGLRWRAKLGIASLAPVKELRSAQPEVDREAQLLLDVQGALAKKEDNAREAFELLHKHRLNIKMLFLRM